MSKKKVVLATRNKGKVLEFNERFGEIGWEIVPLPEDAPEVIEDGLTFEENASKKARSAAFFCGLPALSDDSGLEVDALNGAPGVFSARYAGEHATDEQNNQKLLQALRHIPEQERSARFVCALAFVDCTRKSQVAQPLIVRGTCAGRIVDIPRGKNGFGYDPLLFIPELGKTIAEMTIEEKHRISHRGEAIRHMIDLIRTEHE
ncbi:XTP/dITP diphosphatase [Fodinisporobacter ferrooxydans]|uniref:dITP/XTP pyrophosphatase n=1 Tax=Fodinisporobacter ferrooxydans TaxID=2901836 RepID=A0ABY4CI54_9BACL|nr:XTP/dITP diphosphatase [Alicyclobacillaceae bacterium MYW30-H2]